MTGSAEAATTRATLSSAYTSAKCDRRSTATTSRWSRPSTRELHAERDTVAHGFTHVDGKICWYDAAKYAPTVAHPDAPLGNATRSRKLWRVDGPMTDRTWEVLVGLHFRQNELIQEHLDTALAGQAS